MALSCYSWRVIVLPSQRVLKGHGSTQLLKPLECVLNRRSETPFQRWQLSCCYTEEPHNGTRLGRSSKSTSGRQLLTVTAQTHYHKLTTRISIKRCTAMLRTLASVLIPQNITRRLSNSTTTSQQLSCKHKNRLLLSGSCRISIKESFTNSGFCQGRNGGDKLNTQRFCLHNRPHTTAGSFV